MESIFEELNITSPFQQVSFICSRQFHQQTKVQRATDCIKIIGEIDTCICHFIEKIYPLGSNELTFFTIMKTKHNCGICQWSVHRLYYFIQKLPFYQISQICDPKKLLEIPHVLNNRKIFTQIFHQFEIDDAVIQFILLKMSNTRILFDILAKKIMDILRIQDKSTDGFAKSLIQTYKTDKSLDYYFHILNVCLMDKRFIEINYDAIYKLLIYIFDTLTTIHYEYEIKYDTEMVEMVSTITGIYKKVSPESLVHFILYNINRGIQILDDHVYYCYHNTETSLETDPYLNECLGYFAKHNYKNIEFIQFHMHSKLRFKIMAIIPIEVVVQNTVNRNRGFANNKLHLYVNPREMLYSMANFNVMKKLADPMSYTYVVYQSSNGDYGEDAGGLTRDLYANFPKEVAQYFGEQDEYMIPQDNIFVTHRLWRLIGIMFARSIFYENISPSISIHPIVVYMMMYGYESIQLDHFFEKISPFNIVYMTNLRKIQQMAPEEYNSFLSLQGEEYISKQQYIQSLIIDRYINQLSLQKFIVGFRSLIQVNKNISGTNVCILHHLSFVDFCKYIRGIESYRINVDEDHGSLSRNLKVDPDEEGYQQFWIWEEDADRLKESFIRVLDELNKTNIAMLKLFLQFWFGTDSIADFSHKEPAITILANDNYPGCFGARTCFDELYIHKSILKFKNKALDDKLLEYIQSSVKNQSLTQSIGLNMQIM